MGDKNPIRTLGDYSRPSHEGYRNTINLPEGNNVVPLRSDIIQESLFEAWTCFKDLLQKSLIMASIFGSKSKSFMTMSIPSQDEPLTNRSVDARLSRFEADFKQQQSEMTNKINTVLKAITNQIAGILPSDTVKNPKTGDTSSFVCLLAPRSFNTKFVCSKEDDEEVMFIEIIQDDDEPQNKGERATIKESMRQYIAITDHGLWDVIINGNQLTIELTPVVGQPVTPKTFLTANAKRNNEKALNILLFAIPDGHLLKFHDAKDAKTLWASIKARFRGNDVSKKMHKNLLKQQFKTFTVGSREDLDTTYDRFQNILSMLELYGAPVSSEDTNLKFLRSLPPTWHVVATMIKGQPGLDSLDFDDLYNNLKVYEHEIKGASSSSSQNIAFLSAENKSSTSNEVICSFFTQQASIPQTFSEDLSQIDKYALKEIDIRWQLGYFVRQCKFAKYQANKAIGNKERKFVPIQDSSSKAMAAQDNQREIDWSKEFDDEPVTLALMAASSLSDSTSSSNTEGNPKEELKDHAIIDSGCSRTPRKNDVYSLNIKSIIPSRGVTCLVAKETDDEAILWHRRLGHVNFKNINKLVKGNLVRGLPSKTFKTDHSCLSYKKGKQHKASCKKLKEKTVREPLELLYIDLFGPIIVKSVNKKKYYLVVTDDCSKFSWFKNQLMNEFCAKKRIKKEFSIVRTPQQNGVAKRKNRTLIEAARTMLADLLLPIQFWAEAVNTACYVLTRVLVTKPQLKTPYEILKGKPPSITFMKPFGYPLTILNTLDPLEKFEGKSDEGYLLGYSTMDSSTKGSNTNEEEYNVDDQQFIVHGTGISEDKSRPAEQALQDELNRMLIQETLAKAHEDAQRLAFKKEKRRVVAEKKERAKGVTRKSSLIDVTDIPNDPNMPELKDTNDEFNDEGIFKGSSFDDEISVRSLVLVPHEYKQEENSKKVFRNKRDERGTVIKNKERLVAQGYRQEEGVDYDEVFAPVARIEAIRLFLAFASFIGFIVYLMDVKSAFLYGKITKKVYVKQPPGFKDPSHPNKVYKVIKALYGLHQAPRAWYKRLSTFLLKHGYRRGAIDKTLFIKRDRKDIMLVQFYVDDIIFGSTKQSMVKDLEESLRPATTPIEAHKALGKDDDGEDVDISSHSKEAFSDSDYAGDNHDRRSTASGCQYLGRTLVSWKCKKPIIVTTLLTKAEYVAAASYCGQVRMINEVSHIEAKVAGRKVLASEASIRTDLLFNDEDGIECFTNQVLWDTLRDIGYEGSLTKLTFSKPLFSPQWKYLAHTLLYCLSSKSSSWDQFGTNIAFSLVGIAINQKFNFSRMIFDRMLRHIKDGKPFLMYPSIDHTDAEKEDSLRQDAAKRLDSPNDYTPTDEVQTSGGDKGNLDLYGLNREVIRLKKENAKQAADILKLKAKVKELVKMVKPVVLEYKSFIKKQASLSRKKKLEKKHKKKSSSFKQGRKFSNFNSDVEDTTPAKTRIGSGDTKVIKDIDGTRVDEGTGNIDESTVVPNNESTNAVNENTNVPSTQVVENKAGPLTYPDENNEFFQDDTIIADILVNISRPKRGAGIIISGNVFEQERSKSPTLVFDPKDKEEEERKRLAGLERLQAKLEANKMIAVEMQRAVRDNLTEKQKAKFLVETIAAQRRFRAEQ
ncbi:putative ribonuclease H-like domain-containing protein [Tanacetum coccineum]